MPLLPTIEYSQATWTNWLHWSVDAADLDGDGTRDIAVVGAGNDNMSQVDVYLGQGGGTFGARTTVGSIWYARAIVTKDLNADGWPDLVAASADIGGVTVMLNDGQGGFEPPVGYATGLVGAVSAPRPDMLRIADINGDGILDLITANTSANTVSLLLGQGNGTFPTKLDIPTPEKPTAIAVGDWNADGTVDLAVTTYDATTTKDRVSIMMGLGGGSFGAAVHKVIAKTSRSLATADFNGDGKPDLVSANYNAGSGHKLFVLLNQGNGMFTNPVGYNAGGTGRVVPADMNGDAIVDLVVAAYESKTIEVLLGQGNGTFMPRVPYSAQGTPHAVAVLDFDNDNDKDIVSADIERLTVLENSGTGSLGAVVASAPSIQMVSNVLRSADVNADGYMDLIGGGTSVIRVALGQSNGGFGQILISPLTIITNPLPNEVRNMVLGDMNGDGKPDLVIRDSESGIVVLINQGNGTFVRLYGYGVPHGSSIAPYFILGDFDNDGKLDVATAGTYAFETVPYHRWAERVVVNLFRGIGNGTLAQPQEQVLTERQWDCAYCPGPPGYGTPLTGADFNGDGLMDLALSSASWGGTYTLLNQGNGQFVRDFGPIGAHPSMLYAVDRSGNGLADIVVMPTSHEVQLWRNSGNGSFTYDGNFFGGANDIIPVDLDGDGRMDIASAGTGTNSARVLLDQGSGNVGNLLDYAAGFTPISITAGDWNGDGKMDLAVQNKSPASVSILYNTCLP